MKLLTDYLRELYVGTIEGWNRFWFTAIDPATLGLIRLFAGMMIFYTHLVWSRDLVGFFGPNGRIAPEFAQIMNNSSFAWSWLFSIQSPALLWTTHFIVLIVLAFYMVGLFSRVTSVLAFLITVAYANRAMGSLFGLDQINAMLAMYTMIGPSGAAYSVDNLLWKKTSGRLPYVPSISANLAIRLIQCHMCVIYLFAGTSKLLGDTWWDGTAMWGALANYEYQSIDMTWLAAHPLVINFLTHLTIGWECGYIFLIWPRMTRPIMLTLAVPLHLGIAIFMGMMTFGLAMLIGNLAFVSPHLVRTFVRWPLSKSKLPELHAATN